MKKILFLGGLILIALFAAGCTAVNQANNTSPTSATSSPTNQSIDPKETNLTNLKFPGILPDEKIKNKKAVIVTNKGTIEFTLDATQSPKTVSNFVYLAENHFYDGLTFHRVEPGFVIQGGDPSGNGTGGPGYKFEDEKVTSDYKAGTVAMANAGPNTNGSQFFICLGDQPSLPKLYNIFGQVTKGIDVVKNIQVGDKMTSVTIENQ